MNDLFTGSKFSEQKTVVEAGVYILIFREVNRGDWDFTNKETGEVKSTPKLTWAFDCAESDNPGTKAGDRIVLQTGIDYGGSRSLLTKVVNGLTGKAGLTRIEWGSFNPGDYTSKTYRVILSVDEMQGSKYNEIVSMSLADGSVKAKG